MPWLSGCGPRRHFEMARNSTGEGTIYRRRDGRYEAAAYFLTTSGSRKRLRVYAKTREEAHDLLLEAKVQARQGVPIPDRSWKVGEYLDYWLEQVVRVNRRRTTYGRYEVTVRKHLIPGLGKHSLSRLSVPIVQQFLNERLGEGCSVRGAQIMRSVLSAALTSAQREELLSRNVARLVELPTYEPDEVKPWSTDEATRFLEAANGDPLYVAFVLLLLYGLRRGEVLGLRWSDVDFEKREIYVRQQVQRVKGLLYQAPLKTRAGRRDLPLLGFAETLLVEQRQRRKGGSALGDRDGSGELVFRSVSGRPVEPRNFSRSFSRVCEQSGLRKIRLHDLRHTTATLLKDLGVPARDAQLILGHADIATTQGIYQHDSMEGRRSSLGRVESLFVGVLKRCRQEQPSTTFYTRELALSASGRGRGTRTPGPRFWSSISVEPDDSLNSVQLAVERHGRTLLLGHLAVISSRQIEGASRRPQHGIDRTRHPTPLSASALHRPHCSASERRTL
ncbi:site-specific integrase [Streptomyces olivoreticuli]